MLHISVLMHMKMRFGNVPIGEGDQIHVLHVAAPISITFWFHEKQTDILMYSAVFFHHHLFHAFISHLHCSHVNRLNSL